MYTRCTNVLFICMFHVFLPCCFYFYGKSYHDTMIIVRKLNLESGTPGFESFESAASNQPLDLQSPYLSQFFSLLFLLLRVSLLNSLNQLWNKISSHCRGKSSSREMCVHTFTNFNKCGIANKSILLVRQFLQPV